MTERGYHHGNLRAVLLRNAEELLRASGTDALSLREVARRSGVSHGAPRAHFPDRQALLDALAVEGFERLSSVVRLALSADMRFIERFRLVAHGYVRFAVDDAALMELMFSSKSSSSQKNVKEAAETLFELMNDAVDPHMPPEARQRFTSLFAATMQGIASLITTRRVTVEQGQRMVDDAADMLLQSDLGTQATPEPRI